MTPYGQTKDVLTQVRRLLGETGPSDAQLLARFRDGRDEDAFAELVRRHGPTVLGVARAILRDNTAAEDVFQATFLVLARKAGSIRKDESLGSWLYGVARRVALDSRARAARRVRLERQGRPAPAARASEPPVDDTPAVLAEELGRLPDKYRAPLVLCYLEGKTNEEAATLLGWPGGTVRGRIARARDLLRNRLARRGVGLSAALAALEGQELCAAVPASLAPATTRAALAAGATGHAVPALVQGALRRMFLQKVTPVLGALLLLGALAAGAGLTLRETAAPKSDPGPGEAAARAPAIKEVRKLPQAPPVLPAMLPAADIRPPYDKAVELARVALPSIPNSLAWSPSGAWIAAGTWGGPGGGGLGRASQVHVVDVAKKARHLTLDFDDWVQGLAFSPDGKWLAVATANITAGGPCLTVYRVPGFKATFTVRIANPQGFSDLAWSADGKALVALEAVFPGLGRATVRSWEVPGFAERPAVRAPQTVTYEAIAVSADGKSLAVTDRTDLIGNITVRTFDRATLKQRSSADTGNASTAFPPRLGFTPDGRAVGLLDMKGGLTWWDTGTGKRVAPARTRFAVPLAGLAHYAGQQALSPDGTKQARGYEKHSVVLFDLTPRNRYGLFVVLRDNIAGKSRTWRIADPWGPAPAVTFSPDSNRLAGTIGLPAGSLLVIWAVPK